MSSSAEINSIYLKRITQHPGVVCQKVSNSIICISFSDESWYVWPKTGKFRFVENGRYTSDMFYGDLNHFYHRYIVKDHDLPINHGKIWRVDEDKCIYEMIELSLSLRQIALELARNPRSVAMRISLLFDDKNMKNLARDHYLDTPIIDLIDNLGD